MIQTALIIDDDIAFRAALQRALEKRQVQARIATDPRHAVELFREFRSDLVLLDYRMPERDGLSLLRELHAYNPGSVFIVLTGFGSIQLAVECMKQGADSFLTKPTDADQILAEANKLKEQKRHGPAAIDRWEQRFFNLDFLQRIGIEKAIEATQGNISKAAQLLGIDRRTLQRKMKRYFAGLVVLGGGLGYVVHSPANAAVVVKEQSARERFINLTGDSDFADDRSAWDKTYSREEYVFGKDPVRFLAEIVQKLPKGRVLDLAMGEGRNAVFLAKKGFFVEGVDISRVGIRKALALAAENGVTIEAVNADLNEYRIKPERYSVITNFYYYQPNLFPQIKQGLVPGGIVVLEMRSVDQLKIASRQKLDEKYFLKPGELKAAFQDFEVIHYSEANDGKNAVVRLLARKPKIRDSSSLTAKPTL